MADAIGTVRGLILNGGVPPAVDVKDMTGAREVEANAASLQ